MSKFASTSILLAALVLIIVGALIPAVGFLGFLAGVANIISIVGIVLLVLFLLGTFGWRGLLLAIIYLIVDFGISWLAGILGLAALIGGLVVELAIIAISLAITLSIAKSI